MLTNAPTYTPTDPEIRDEMIATVRKWVAREVIPVASELEHADEYPAAIVEAMKDLGLFGITIPEEYGGLGLDLLTYIGVIEELAYGWMTLSGVINTHTMCATLIGTYGTDAQKQRWLPQMVTGARRGALSLSEPDAGTDTRNIACRAVRDGDEWIVNGTKAWVTNGERAGIVALAARTEEGISAFIVEKEPGPVFEGVSVSKNVGKLGYKGIETVEMAYADHRIPADALIGTAGRGLTQILSVLEVGRINIAARAVGVARAAFDAALSYAQQRVTMGKPIAEHQAIQLKLADMATKLEAARLLTKSAAERKQAGLRCDVEAGMAKLFASETALEVATESMRIHGGVGYTTELPVERYFRDAPLMIIGEGTNEIQRIVIARGLLARARARRLAIVVQAVPTTLTIDAPLPGVVVVQLNRPNRLNALNDVLVQELQETCASLAEDPDVRVVVLTGAGRGFCAGIDLRGFGPSAPTASAPAIDRLRFQEMMGALPQCLRDLPQPVVAAVNGPAVGGGMALCLASDVRICGASAKFGNGAVRIGLSGAEMGMSYHLPRIVGTSVAADWMLTGRLVGAEEALRAGLVSALVDDDQLLDHALDLAAQIAANSRFGVQLTKRALQVNTDASDLSAALEIENRNQVLAHASEESRAAWENWSRK